ncbi:hypothetical protein AB0G67_48575 [Streptomyces sp. NPDC021056]|uniref:hypothetical protein n=1 Tax=Streptomyces sp. NPDC021056 TaxID=3155012 RepID=UPI0033FB3815
MTPEQLATQRELIAFAELRVEAAQRTTARMREDERASLAATSKAVAEELLTGDSMSDIATAAKTAADAVASLAALVNARNAAITEIGSVLADIDNDLVANADAKGAWASKRYGVWAIGTPLSFRERAVRIDWRPAGWPPS